MHSADSEGDTGYSEFANFMDNSEMDIETIEKMISEFLEADFVGGVSDEEINAASARVEQEVKGGYRSFLRRLGCGAVESEEFIGLGGPKHLDFARVTESLRSRRGPSHFPNGFIPVLADGFGNYECIDTRTKSALGESPVVIWLHDGGDEQRCEQVGMTYLDWLGATLERLLEETR